jgi:CPA2 family monovalent cation:H+ antiporter-2
MVGVSSITAFASPLLIRHSPRVALWVDGRLPGKLRTFVPLYASWLEELRARGGQDVRWSQVRRAFRAILLDSLLVVALVAGTSLSSERLQVLLGEATGITPRAANLLIMLGFAMLCPWPVYGILRAARRLAGLLSEIVMPRGAGVDGKPAADTAAAPRRALVVVVQIAIVLAVGVPLLAITDPFLPGIPVIGAVLLLLVLVLSWTFWRRAADLEGHVRAGAEIIAEALQRASQGDRSFSMGDLQALLPGLGEIASHPIDAQCPSVGRSLSELDLRGRTGANVVAISREGGSVLLPEGNERLRAGDLLGIRGSHAACDAARTLLRKGLPAESVQEVEAERFGSDPPG